MLKKKKFQEVLKKEYPKCSGCSFLEIRGKYKVYCFYRKNNKCILSKDKEEDK